MIYDEGASQVGISSCEIPKILPLKFNPWRYRLGIRLVCDKPLYVSLLMLPEFKKPRQ
jgi:hypothetical protein